MEQGTASSVVGKTCTEISLSQIKYTDSDSTLSREAKVHIMWSAQGHYKWAMHHGKRTTSASVYATVVFWICRVGQWFGFSINLRSQVISPPFATTMCDKFLAEEFVEIRVSFNGERFNKSSYVLSKAMCGPEPVHSDIRQFLNLFVFPLG